MINWTTIENALYDYIVAITGRTVIWENEDDARPNFPYITLGYDPLTQIGIDYESRADGDGNTDITGNREFTVSIQHDSNTAQQGVTDLETLRMSFNKFTKLETLRASGLVFVNADPILNLDFLEDTKHVHRKNMDVLFRIAQTDTDAPGLIETVEAEGTYDNHGTEIVEDITIEIT